MYITTDPQFRPKVTDEQVIALIEEQPMTLGEIATALRSSSLKMRPILEQITRNGYLEIRRQRYILGPCFDPPRFSSCGEVALELVMTKMRPGNRYTESQLVDITGLDRENIRRAMDVLTSRNELSMTSCLHLKIYERTARSQSGAGHNPGPARLNTATNSAGSSARAAAAH